MRTPNNRTRKALPEDIIFSNKLTDKRFSLLVPSTKVKNNGSLIGVFENQANLCHTYLTKPNHRPKLKSREESCCFSSTLPTKSSTKSSPSKKAFPINEDLCQQMKDAFSSGNSIESYTNEELHMFITYLRDNAKELAIVQKYEEASRLNCFKERAESLIGSRKNLNCSSNDENTAFLQEKLEKEKTYV